MNAQIIALRKSIAESWYPRAFPESNLQPFRSCPLCALNNEISSYGRLHPVCNYCPVAIKTGEEQCKKTVYYDYLRAHGDKVKLAKEMFYFLLSILPADQTIEVDGKVFRGGDYEE